MIVLFWLLFIPITCDFFEETEISLDIQRVLYKRDALDNYLRDDVNSTCRNGGILSSNECHCPFPHTGKTCQDFDCQNGGISVGWRYDPNSFLFSKPCLCKNGFQGDLCQYKLETKCSGRGEWKNGKCQCIEFFFGSYCQFTSNCVFGTIRNGRCICRKGYEGKYCQNIVCYHGYSDVRNQSQSCVCPAKYRGLHCDKCAQTGPHIAKYPVCIYRKPLKIVRRKIKQQAISQITIMLFCGIALLSMVMGMFAIRVYKQSKRNPAEEEMRMQQLIERRRMLAEAAVELEPEPEDESKGKLRKISFANLFKRRQSTDGRKTSVFQRYKRQQSSPGKISEPSESA